MSNKQIVIKEEIVTSLDKAAADYQLSVADATPFKKAFMLAEAMNNMRALLTNEVMEPIMALMNTDLGFRTDKDPRVWNSKKNNGQGGYNDPYPVEVVRDVLIESTLRGFFPVGNEFNLIAGRFYAAKAGVRRKVQQWPGLTDLKDTRDVPQMKQGGAVVSCVATWTLNGKADSLVIDIAVKVNEMMGADAILGKAERKQMKLILDRISGEVTPDGDVDDAPLGTEHGPAKAPTKVESVPKAAKPVAGADKTVKEANHETVTEKPEASQTSPQKSETPPADASVTDDDKKAIQKEEASAAARELMANDPETALGMLMDVEGVTADELANTLRFFKVQIPADFKGPASLSAKRIGQIMEPKAWKTLVLDVHQRQRAAATNKTEFPA